MSGERPTPAAPLQGVIFDMDGTLTVPVIDFVRMRERVGILQGDILAELRRWPADRRARGFAIIEEIEAEACERLELQPGTRDLVEFLDRRGLRRGLITRNTERTVRCFVRHLGREFDSVVTREFEPVKPAPDSVHHICRQWGMPPAAILMVGDYRDDMLCGRSAGARTCLLRNERNSAYSALADFTVGDLFELKTWIEGMLVAGEEDKGEAE